MATFLGLPDPKILDKKIPAPKIRDEKIAGSKYEIVFLRTSEFLPTLLFFKFLAPKKFFPSPFGLKKSFERERTNPFEHSIL